MLNNNNQNKNVCGGISAVFQQATALTAASLFGEALSDAHGIDVDKIRNLRDTSAELIESHGVMGAFDLIRNQSSVQSPAFG